MSEAKQFDISKKAVIAAFQAVKENAGSYGADEQTIKEFEEHLNNNLYKLWNRMASGSYFPKPVRAVAIPKCIIAFSCQLHIGCDILVDRTSFFAWSKETVKERNL